MKYAASATAAALLIAVAAPVAAQPLSERISGEISIELQNDWTYKSEDRANQNNDLYTHNRASADNADSHFQISARYAFAFGLTVDVGWKVSEDDATETRTLGILAAYAIEF